MNKKNLIFIVKSTFIYTFAYLLIGAIAYQLITKQFYIGDNPIFTIFMRSESNAAEWPHVQTWMIPGLLLRGFLISAVLLPFVETLKKMSFTKRVGIMFALMFVLVHFAAAAPSPSNIEGLIYMKPELVGIKSFLLTQPEMIFQSLLFALGLSWIIRKPGKKNNTTTN